MKVVTKVAAAVLLAAMTAAPAFAAATTTTTTVTKAAPKPAAKMVSVPAKRVLTFRQIDLNNDGRISYAELRRFFPHLTKKQFAADDRNRDGYYDRLDLVAFFKVPRNSVIPRPVVAKTITKTVTTKTVTKTN